MCVHVCVPACMFVCDYDKEIITSCLVAYFAHVAGLLCFWKGEMTQTPSSSAYVKPQYRVTSVGLAMPSVNC